MSILPYQEIQRRIKADGLIHGADLDSCLSPASYELRIGSIRPIEGESERKLAKGEEFVMKEGASVLVGTLEEVRLPDDVAGFLFLKSSLGRSGYVPWSQGYVDPDTMAVSRSHSITSRGSFNCSRVIRKSAISSL
jgi:deoxycytidine triphosphate deaminase